MEGKNAEVTENFGGERTTPSVVAQMDQEKKTLVDVRNSAGTTIYSMEKRLGEYKVKIPAAVTSERESPTTEIPIPFHSSVRVSMGRAWVYVFVVSHKARLQHSPFIRRFPGPSLTHCRPYSSSSSSHQWRKLKNQWLSNKAPFPPSCGSGKKKRLIPQLAHTAGPTCISQLAEEASDKLEFLPSWDSIDQDLLLLYGQYGSTLVNHMDVEKASEIEESETCFFSFHLPSSYLCFVFSGGEFDLSNPETPPK
eukprot:TRINITY_DN5319_c0_g1_i2.p1 TRINITY_DN5319_c0_g1~~TRINITY_DN5319_c0_g1_i2.p1  ORF type:complete len:252 (+),score=23.98 TRINITY_DN5319_c0_g1_i2:321-1076(+)